MPAPRGRPATLRDRLAALDSALIEFEQEVDACESIDAGALESARGELAEMKTRLEAVAATLRTRFDALDKTADGAGQLLDLVDELVGAFAELDEQLATFEAQ